MKYSIILINHSKPESAMYGFYSWLIQKCSFDYEVILVHCDKTSSYEKIYNRYHVKNCTSKIFYLEPPKFFNLSSFRNIGGYYSKGERLIFASVDIIRKTNFLKSIDENTNHKCLCSFGSFHLNDFKLEIKEGIKEITTNKRNFDEIIDSNLLRNGGKHTINYGTLCLDKKHFVSIGGYNMDLYFHEDMEFDCRANEYFKRLKEDHPIIRYEDTKLFSGVKCWTPERKKHSSIIPKGQKRVSIKKVKKVDFSKWKFESLKMSSEQYFKDMIYRETIEGME